MIRITSKIDGFRRAGMAHSRQPSEYPDDYFTPVQLAQLEADPNLVVQQLQDRPKVGNEKTVTKNSKAP